MTRDDAVRLRVIDAALTLLIAGGREAVSTRAVTSAAGIQAPTLYRIFGDKHGLLGAVAAHGFATHLDQWQGWQDGADPLDEIRQGWDMHVAWGVANPHLYSIAYGDARPGINSPAAQAIDAILRTLVEHAASAGMVIVPIDHAVHMLRAVGTGVVFTLIAMPQDRRDAHLSHRGREAVLSAILAPTTSAAPAATRSGSAMQLKSEIDGATALSANEKALLRDWLDRLAAG